jgi:DNA-binding NarL/FixJ family response regulator/class 3 adenylate cyclase
MSVLPTGTVTFVLADVEGSTRLVQETGAGYPELLGSVRRILRDAVAAYDGIEVDAIGDELLAVFTDPSAAVGAALAAQREAQVHEWPTAMPVRMRLGVHTGLAQLDDDEGYVGLDIIRASRITGAGHGGQIVVSSTTAAFASGYDTRDLGTHRLAGLAEPEHIYQLVGDGLPLDFPPLRNTVSQLGAGRRVAIAEDTVLLREGVARLLGEAGFDVVAQSGTAEDLLRHVAMHKPDVAIVDIRMPPTYTDEGLRAAAEIRERFPDTGVLVLSQYVESGYALDLLAESAEGVGYLLKDRVADIEEFATAVARVADGGSALDPEVVSHLVGRHRSDDPLHQLTAREREVLEFMAEGRSNQAIAERLFVTLRAVEKHVTSIFSKLDLAASSDDHRRVLAVLAYLRG